MGKKTNKDKTTTATEAIIFVGFCGIVLLAVLIAGGGL